MTQNPQVFLYKFLEGLRFQFCKKVKRLPVRVNVPDVTQSLLCYIKTGAIL